MRSNRLRHPVTLQRPVKTEDEVGEEIVTFVDVASVFAEVLAPKGRTYLAARKAHAELTTRVTIRYRDDVEPTWRVLFGDRVLEIDHVADVGGRFRELEMQCREIVA